MRRRFTLTLAVATLPALTALPASAQFWEYGAWRVYVETRETSEHTSRTCSAITGGDGYPSLSLTVNELDAGPPADYPAPTLHENAPRGQSTQIQNGQAVAFVIDKQAAFYGIANGYLDSDGFAQAQVGPRWQDTVNMLLWMQAGQSIDIRTVQPYAAGTPVLQVSLAGFTAVYGKMMDECGFSIQIAAPTQ
jgi:hypothetical protein